MDKKWDPHSMYGNLPVRVQPVGSGQNAQWRTGIVLFCPFRGRFTLQIGRLNYPLEDGRIGIVNQYQVFSLSGTDGIGALLELDALFFSRFARDFAALSFPAVLENGEDALRVRQCLAALLQQLQTSSGEDALPALEECVRLARCLSSLSTRRAGGAEHSDAKGQKQQRLNRILSYLEEHYRRRITLQELADREYVSLHYLSKYIKENLGTGFSEYLAGLRLNKSIGELSSTRAPVSEIAEAYGFSSVKSYNRAFRAAYGLSPADYRRRVSEASAQGPMEGAPADWDNPGGDFREAVEAFVREQQGGRGSRQVERLEVAVNLEKRAAVLVTFRKTLYFQFVSDLLNAKWQSDLAAVQQEARFRYISFAGYLPGGCISLTGSGMRSTGSTSTTFSTSFSPTGSGPLSS